MVARIVVDVVQRRWRVIAWAVLQLIFYSKTLRSIWPSLDPMGFMLVSAGYLTLWPGPQLKMRELYQLPVSRRDWWLARWWLSTAGVSAVATSATLAAQWIVRAKVPAMQNIAMYGATAFLYTGSIVALHTTSFGRKADEPATFTSVVVGAPLVFALVLVPLLLSKFLPHRFGDIHALAAAAMTAALFWTIRGYFNRPKIAARPGRGYGRPESSNESLSEAPTSSRISDRLTGFRLAFWDEWRMQLITFALVIVLAFAGWAVSSAFRPVPAFVAFLQDIDALPFASARAHVSEQLTWTFLFFFTNMREPWLLSSARRLRSLPMSSARFSLLPLALALVSVSALWIVLLTLHVLVLRSVPVSPRCDLFVAFAGLTALAHAIRVIVAGRSAIRSMLPLAPAAVLLMSIATFVDSWKTWHPEIVQPAMFVGGVLMMALSVAIVRYSLLRSAWMYRPQPLVVRLG